MVYADYLSVKRCDASKFASRKENKETEITLQNIKEFSHFQLINAMNDFDDMFIYPIERIVNLPESSDYLDV